MDSTFAAHQRTETEDRARREERADIILALNAMFTGSKELGDNDMMRGYRAGIADAMLLIAARIAA